MSGLKSQRFLTMLHLCFHFRNKLWWNELLAAVGLWKRGRERPMASASSATREMSQEQGTGAQHWAPGGALVWGGKWPDSWTVLLMPWPTSRWSATERPSTACSPVPSKSISRAKLVFEHTPVVFLLQLDSFPAQSHSHACGSKASRVCECAGNSPAGGWAWQH